MPTMRKLLRLALSCTLMTMVAAMPAWAQKVRLSTSAGDIVLQLDAEKAPQTVANFVEYVKTGHYNGTVFHRVIDGFMIQGGGLDAKLREKPTRPPIRLEAGKGLSNVRGAIAMARTGNPDSATAQFFINVADNPRLDTHGGGYAVFGKVVEGMDVVDRIKALPTQPQGPHQNVPLDAVTITKATLEK
jgi:peptidyl-prolyl cis-trans isomerase A (cyclophilin A)